MHTPASNSIHTLSLSVLDVPIAVASDCATTIDFVNQYLSLWIRKSHEREPAVKFCILRQSDRLIMSVNGSVISEDNECSLLGSLQREIETAVIARLRSLAAIHAGVVAYKGKAILLPGRSGSGKTTLVRELISRGAEYFSDELALIDPTGLVYPFPRALMVRDKNGEGQPVLPSEFGASIGNAPLRAGLIFALAYRPNARFQVSELTQSAAMLRLLENTPQAVEDTPEIVVFFRKASTNAECFEGERGEVAEAAEAILAMAARNP